MTQMELDLQLNETEEAVLALMLRISQLEHDNENLRHDNKELRWRLTEQD
jgi:regulator of replication initiation timing